MGRFHRYDARATGARRAAGALAVLVLVVVGGLGGLALAVATAEPADAHAVLESTEPADGATLDAAPRQVVLRFSESVQTVDDGIVLYEGSGDTLDTGEPEHPDGEGSAVAVDLPDIGDGAYVVSWRVISSDSHPISGAFTFQVGDVDPAEAEALRASLGDAGSGGDDTLGVVYGIARFAAFAGLILLVGGAAFALGVWPRGISERRVRQLVIFGWGLAVVATLACIGLQGAYGNGLSLGDAFDPSVIGDELDARAGRVWLARLVLLAVVAAAGWAFLRRYPAAAGWGSGPDATAGAADRSVGAAAAADEPAGAGDVAVAERGSVSADGGTPPRVPTGATLDEVRYVGSLLALALLATISLAGHAGAGRLVGLAIATDIVHLAGVSVWLGGLAVLVLVLLRRDTAGLDRGGLERVVGRFSAVAFVAVLTIVVSGVVQAWRQLDGWSALTDTSYGRLLLVKVGLVAGMVVAAGFSRAWLRGRFLAATDRAAGADGTDGEGDRNRPRSDIYLLRQSVGIEALVAVVVLAVTSALVQAPPEEAEAAGDSGTFQTEVHGANVRVDVTVDPTEVGPNDVDIQVAFHDGTPLEPEEVSASLSLPERDLGPLDLELEPAGTGLYRASGADIPFPGAWELEVVVRTSDIDQDRLTAPFTVG